MCSLCLRKIDMPRQTDRTFFHKRPAPSEECHAGLQKGPRAALLHGCLKPPQGACFCLRVFVKHAVTRGRSSPAQDGALLPEAAPEPVQRHARTRRRAPAGQHGVCTGRGRGTGPAPGGRTVERELNPQRFTRHIKGRMSRHYGQSDTACPRIGMA